MAKMDPSKRVLGNWKIQAVPRRGGTLKWSYIFCLLSQQILNRNPYHIDSMLQLSEICKMGEDSQMATELIERTLFAMEAAFHPLFNLSVGISRWSIFQLLVALGNCWPLYLRNVYQRSKSASPPLRLSRKVTANKDFKILIRWFNLTTYSIFFCQMALNLGV